MNLILFVGPQVGPKDIERTFNTIYQQSVEAAWPQGST